jgi:hypothetical protein
VWPAGYISASVCVSYKTPRRDPPDAPTKRRETLLFETARSPNHVGSGSSARRYLRVVTPIRRYGKAAASEDARGANTPFVCSSKKRPPKVNVRDLPLPAASPVTAWHRRVVASFYPCSVDGEPSVAGASGNRL